MTQQQHISKDKETIRQMFNSIAGRYDFLNHFLSANIDKLWRKRMIKKIMHSQAGKKTIRILDIATGTCDLAIQAAERMPNAHITGIDIAEGMLAIGTQKVAQRALDNRITTALGDAENIHFEDNTFDVVMVSFGVRNYTDLAKGLKESFRVLKTEGSLFILEFSTPSTFPIKQLYLFYFSYILPFFGRLISKDKKAYSYLNKSVLEFPQREAFLNKLNAAGYNKNRFTSLSFGIATIYQAQKV